MPHRLFKDQFSRHPKVNRGEGWVFLQVVRFLIQFGWYNFPAQERHIHRVSGRYQGQRGIFRCWTIRDRKYFERSGQGFTADVQKLIYVASLPTILLYFNAIFIDIIRDIKSLIISSFKKPFTFTLLLIAEATLRLHFRHVDLYLVSTSLLLDLLLNRFLIPSPIALSSTTPVRVLLLRNILAKIGVSLCEMNAKRIGNFLNWQGVFF